MGRRLLLRRPPLRRRQPRMPLLRRRLKRRPPRRRRLPRKQLKRRLKQQRKPSKLPRKRQQKLKQQLKLKQLERLQKQRKQQQHSKITGSLTCRTKSMTGRKNGLAERLLISACLAMAMARSSCSLIDVEIFIKKTI